ncbi:MerR family transcriptional regulator [Staphylococcus sp. SQ8-PEA]|uniref:MerR family transcriptional regulator n=1 Tax=Staphylococcus marylandisciuri TaxID=2981529 RepID=A0ABT2QQR8_9STAP|nr:MerR family transcriptional regulator [Staphylococcus marylandisciuri]MCU5746321.1 MerR family transcriptional regulator [Staphylococcus marylandisciuri]
MTHYYSMKQITEITGVTKRTLHHYDEIGLLTPSQRQDNGYRQYSQDNLIRLQKIIFLKGLGISLNEVNKMIDLDEETLRRSLQTYQTQMKEKINNLQRLNDNLLSFLDGTPLLKLDIYELPLQQQYATEASYRYGHTAVYQSLADKRRGNEASYSEEEVAQMDSIFEAFNQLAERNAPYEDSKHIVERWKRMLNQYADFSDDLLCCIADTYDEDPRFQDYFKQFSHPKITQVIADHVHFHLDKCSE